MVYCIDPQVEEPIMLINKHIGFDEKEGQGIDGSLFQSELLQLDGMGKKRIQVWINSPGGIVMDGYNIYSAILKTKTKVDTYNVGIAASIAAVIFQAGRTRTMADYSSLMYHDPYGGNSKELEVMKESLATMISQRSGIDLEFVRGVMKRTTWIAAAEALNDGFCDEVEASSEHNKKRATIAPQGVVAMHRICNSILNEKFSQIKFPKNKQTMNKVTNKLGLANEASEESILNAIVAIENKAKTEAEDSAKLKAKLEEAEELCNSLKKKVQEAEEKETEAKNAAKMAEEDKVKNECKSMVAGFVTSGKIKNEAVPQWEETAQAMGVEKVKAMLEALPVSKIANKLPIIEVGGASLTNVAASTMAEVRNKMGL